VSGLEAGICFAGAMSLTNIGIFGTYNFWFPEKAGCRLVASSLRVHQSSAAHISKFP
jgi:hypothetical protein